MIQPEIVAYNQFQPKMRGCYSDTGSNRPYKLLLGVIPVIPLPDNKGNLYRNNQETDHKDTHPPSPRRQRKIEISAVNTNPPNNKLNQETQRFLVNTIGCLLPT